MKDERYDLIPTEALATVAKLYGFGAKKYAAHNWRRGYEWSKSYAAMRRHDAEFWRGVDIDPETGLPHLAAVVFHALTLLTFMEEQKGFDDRFGAEGPIETPETQEERLESLRARLAGPSEWEKMAPRHDLTIDPDGKERCGDPKCCVPN
jgi:hypothetical protein